VSRQRTRRPGGAGALLAGLLLCAGAPAIADVWKKVDRNGVTHLSDQYLGPGSVLIMKTRSRRAPRGAASSRAYRDRVAQLTPLIDRTAARYRLDPVLVHAVIRAESAYRADAVSNKGAVGLMQLMPGTARRYGVSDRADPAQNLSGGIRYLRDLLLQFRSVSLALAAYNAGEGAVMKNGNRIPPYAETRDYVSKVIRFYREARKKS
jgi:soluble lytic murein transglycosylase-like protein